jgi:hypothetical protein
MEIFRENLVRKLDWSQHTSFYAKGERESEGKVKERGREGK